VCSFFTNQLLTNHARFFTNHAHTAPSRTTRTLLLHEPRACCFFTNHAHTANLSKPSRNTECKAHKFPRILFFEFCFWKCFICLEIWFVDVERFFLLF
jgi:hypothetical protein